jgi:beta-xylosidase
MSSNCTEATYSVHGCSYTTKLCRCSAIAATERCCDSASLNRRFHLASDEGDLVVEAIVLWNEPNNLSHWNFHLDPNWERFAAMVKTSCDAIRRVNPKMTIVLGGVSSCDCDFLRLMRTHGVMEYVDAVGVHGFPLDWNHWQLTDWPDRVAEAAAVSGLPVWATEVGVSSFGAEEVQEFGMQRTLDLLKGRVERLHWYSLFDLPPSWPAETRHKEAEGSAYYRHYYLGLLRDNAIPKLAARHFPKDGSVGFCQWFHFEDPRLESAASWMLEHGVEYLRTGLSWADSYRPQATEWFDRQMRVLEPFRVALTLCFTPAHLGLEEHHTSPPRDNEQFAEFAAWAVQRYAPVRAGSFVDSQINEMEESTRYARS